MVNEGFRVGEEVGKAGVEGDGGDDWEDTEKGKRRKVFFEGETREEDSHPKSQQMLKRLVSPSLMVTFPGETEAASPGRVGATEGRETERTKSQ